MRVTQNSHHNYTYKMDMNQENMTPCLWTQSHHQCLQSTISDTIDTNISQDIITLIESFLPMFGGKIVESTFISNYDHPKYYNEKWSFLKKHYIVKWNNYLKEKHENLKQIAPHREELVFVYYDDMWNPIMYLWIFFVLLSTGYSIYEIIGNSGKDITLLVLDIIVLFACVIVTPLLLIYRQLFRCAFYMVIDVKTNELILVKNYLRYIKREIWHEERVLYLSTETTNDDNSRDDTVSDNNNNNNNYKDESKNENESDSGDDDDDNDNVYINMGVRSKNNYKNYHVTNNTLIINMNNGFRGIKLEDKWVFSQNEISFPWERKIHVIIIDASEIRYFFEMHSDYPSLFNLGRGRIGKKVFSLIEFENDGSLDLKKLENKVKVEGIDFDEFLDSHFCLKKFIFFANNSNVKYVKMHLDRIFEYLPQEFRL